MIKSAMILAAGRGLRMQPLTHTLPKPLISVAGKTMLGRVFEHLKRIKVSNIVVNAHYLAPLMEEYIQTHHPETLISHEDILLETGGGIKKALPLLGEGPFLTLNGDSIWSGREGLEALEAGWDGEKMDVLLLLISREKGHGYQGRGDFFISEEGRLSRFQKDKEAPYVYMGVQLVHPRLFDDAPGGPFSMNGLWDKAMQEGRLYGTRHKGDWFHISTPRDLEKYERQIRESEAITESINPC